MLRIILIYLSRAEWLRRMMTGWKLARRVALRFVAGEKLADALRVVKEINQSGMTATLDQLGEDTHTEEEAAQTAQEIIEIIEAIHSSGSKSNVSIKLTQIGLGLNEGVCRQNLEKILSRAKELGTFVRIDMEDSPYTTATLRLFDQMSNRGFDNVGVVLQSYLYRSEGDLHQLLAAGARIRVVKGAYMEPPEAAYPEKYEVDHAFDVLARLMLDASLSTSAPAASEDGKWPPIAAIATHDEVRILNARKYAEKIGLDFEKIEFQMLYGIGRDLQERLVKAGYPVRIYVPFGSQWFPYFMRRLAERPANMWFFISNFFRR